jgi:mxaD protein
MSQKRPSLRSFPGCDHASDGKRWSAHIWIDTDRVKFVRELRPAKFIDSVGAWCFTKEDRRENRHFREPEAVWGLIGDFAKISNWNPAVTSSKANIDPDQGQERILTIKNGSIITDVQPDYDATKMTYSYRRVDDDVKAFPVSFYSATITVTPTATGSEVDWIGRFYRGDTSNEPPPGLDDQDAINAMTEFFQTGLKHLKALAKKK